MQHDTRPAITLPLDVRLLLEAPNYVHLSTLRADGRPRNHVVWAGLEGDRVLICTSDWTWKAKDMRRDPRVALSVIDRGNPYQMAALQGRVAEERPDEGCRLMDPIETAVLPRIPGAEPRRLVIAVRDGVVLISGRVETRSAALRLAAAARQAEGVIQVDDDLRYDIDDRYPAVPACF